MKKATRLVEILQATSSAHHEAFTATNGQDDEWSKWYAQYLLEKTEFASLVRNFDAATLAHLLEMLDHQYQNERTKQDWTEYYATKLLKIG